MMRIDSLKFQSVSVAFSVAFSLFGCGGAQEHHVDTGRDVQQSEDLHRPGGQPRPTDALMVAGDKSSEGGVDPGEQLSREALDDVGRTATVAPLPGAKNLVPIDVAKWSLKDLVPFQSFPAVPGSLVGIIWSGGQQPWGSGYNHGALPASSIERSDYKFGVDGSSPYAVYFASDGRGYNFLQNWAVPVPAGASGPARTANYNAAMFNAKTPNTWGLSRLAHVVEVDVNDKQGGIGIHFVITNARVIDGTSAFPPRADDVLLGLRPRFNAYLATQEDVIRGKLESAVNAQPKSFRFGPRVVSVVGVFPTWNTAKQAMEVLFTRVSSHTGQGARSSMSNPCPPCPPGAPCARCDEHQMMPAPALEISVPTAVRYLVDKSGTVIAETRYLPTAPNRLQQAGGE